MPSREDILSEIRRCAAENGGQPLGRIRFERETGIVESSWAGRYWVSWGDAVREAGFKPNELQGKYDDAEVLGALAALIRRLGKFPVENELRMARRQDPDFPSHGTIQRLGNKAQRARLVIEYCEDVGGFPDVVEFAEPVAAKQRPASPIDDEEADGYVYLMKSGKHYKIGRSNAPGRREYELAIQLPERLERVHVIRTDDPPGIERYWHLRFADKRSNGEWFKLSAQDVRSFKRRGKFM
jgi:hypothetical protein